MHKVTAFLPAAVLFLGSGFVLNTHSQAAIPLAAPLTSILDTVPGYQVHDLTLTDDERRVAGMNEYVARSYTQDTTVAFTTFVSYYERQTQGKTIHSPRNCLPGAGWEILTPGTQDLVINGKTETVNHYVLKNGPATAVVLYWYQGRGRIVANEYRVKWNLLRDAALAGHTEEALVRVVVPVPSVRNNDSPDATNKAIARANELGATIAVRLAGDVARVIPSS